MMDAKVEDLTWWSPMVQGFSYVFSRMDKLLGFGQVPNTV